MCLTAYRNGLTEKLGYQQGLLQTPIYQSYEEQTRSATQQPSLGHQEVSSVPQQKPCMPYQEASFITLPTQKWQSSLPKLQQQPRGHHTVLHFLHKLQPQQAHQHHSIVYKLCTLIRNIAFGLQGPSCQRQNLKPSKTGASNFGSGATYSPSELKWTGPVK